MWECSKEDPQDEDRESERLWAKYRDFNFDHIPVQVKNSAVWVELCYRYAPKICVIGHRSGFIEAAALVGIPTFYLNNEREDITPGNDFMKSGEVLWKPIKEPGGSRLRLLGTAMDTFIAIESLYDPEPKKGSKKASEISKDATDRSNDDKQKQCPRCKNLKPPKEIYEVQDKYKDELAAALFMYMCCELIPSKQDPGPIKAMQRGNVPAWTQRVWLMHYDNQKGWPRLKQKLLTVKKGFDQIQEEVQQEKQRLLDKHPRMSRKEMRKTTRPIRAEAAKRFRKEASSMGIGSEWLEGTIDGLNEKLQFEERLGQQWLKANYDFAISAIKEAEAPWNPEGPPQAKKNATKIEAIQSFV